MENLAISNLDYLYSDICEHSESCDTQSAMKSLESCVKYTTKPNTSPYICLNDKLLNTETYNLTKQLAKAVDNNDIEQIKMLKEKYSNKKCFAQAKEFLNEKCKQVWSVYESPKTIPYEAMKILGITNQPELDTLLGNSVRYFEKHGGNTTIQIISSVLKNPILNYTIDDIYKYLCDIRKTENMKYNKNTIKYFILKHKFSRKKLYRLGISRDEIKSVCKGLNLFEKLTYWKINL